jgi:hypothetical protein
MRRVLLSFAVLGIVVIAGAALRARPAEAGPSTAITAGDDAVPAGAVGKDCTFKGKRLFGKVQIVKSFPDLKVQQVTSFPDLKVQKVTSFPDKCGKWQFVDSFPDLKIQYVTSFPDVKVQFVTSFPGVP